jgi:hypothetical protein
LFGSKNHLFSANRWLVPPKNEVIAFRHGAVIEIVNRVQLQSDNLPLMLISAFASTTERTSGTEDQTGLPQGLHVGPHDRRIVLRANDVHSGGLFLFSTG